MLRRIAIVLCIIGLTGCASYRAALQDTAEYINAIEGKGCLCINAVGGGGFGATINGALTGFASHGDIDPEICLRGCIVQGRGATP